MSACNLQVQVDSCAAVLYCESSHVRFSQLLCFGRVLGRILVGVYLRYAEPLSMGKIYGDDHGIIWDHRYIRSAPYASRTEYMIRLSDCHCGK